jgi:signal transduction histidine kinase
MGGLAFFGKMSASISHEIKNYLAIINEKAGLCTDLILLAKDDRPLDPKMVKDLAENISQQVKRADQVVKNLNRLGHSIDEPLCSLDLNKLVELLISMCHRLASQKKIRLEMSLPSDSVSAENSPFFLMYTLFHYLDWAMNEAVGGEIQVDLKEVDDSAEVTIAHSSKATGQSADVAPEKIPELEEKLGIRVDVDGKKGELVIHVPKTFGDE